MAEGTRALCPLGVLLALQWGQPGIRVSPGWILLCLGQLWEQGGSTRSVGILELSPASHQWDVWGKLVQPQGEKVMGSGGDGGEGQRGGGGSRG